MEGYSSLNLLSELNNLDPKQKEALLNGVRWVRHNAPEAVLIGGAAVAHHITKSRPLTPDFDFIIYEDEIDEIKYLLDKDNIKFSNLFGNIGIQIKEFNIDFIYSKSRKLDTLMLGRSLLVNINHHQMKVISPEVLIIAKMELGRDKDIDDALLLLESGVMQKHLYEYNLDFLKDELENMESYKAYIKMM